MRIEELKNKLWFNIFIRVAAIFVVFVSVLCIANFSSLVSFFGYKQKNLLKEKLLYVCSLKLSDSDAVLDAITEINDEYNFDVEIYNASGEITYTTRGGQMLDFFGERKAPQMMHEEMITLSQQNLSDGVVFQTAKRVYDSKEYLICKKKINGNSVAEVKIQKQIIKNSATAANEFIIIISSICFVGAVIWVLLFARKFSKPITQMTEITTDMANLNFERKLEIDGSNEIARLADSVNILSDSLSNALLNLQKTNAKLLNDIELERQLDVMRKQFIANVSHELKTPISIISGYAEGLKLNINPRSRDEYCDTIIEESKRMNKLVLSILELSKYESGQIPVSKQNYDINEQVTEMLGRIFKSSTVVTKNLIPQNTVVFADKIQIEQVLKSLLENALSHTKSDGKVTADCTENGNKIRILITNTGSHIDDDIMPDIWQSFFRGEQSHKRESTRFGLGLSIVAAIMRMHETNCGVYNTEDGVCFWFELQKKN